MKTKLNFRTILYVIYEHIQMFFAQNIDSEDISVFLQCPETSLSSLEEISDHKKLFNRCEMKTNIHS